MSNIDDFFAPLGATAQFAAANATTAGDLMIIKSNGDAEKISGAFIAENAGANTPFNAATSNFIAVADGPGGADADIVVAYQDASNSFFGTVVGGNISGSAISWGTPVVFSSVTTQDIAIVRDVNANKYVVSYLASSNGKARTITFSLLVPSFGTEATYEAGNAFDNAITYDSTAQKTFLSYRTNASQLAAIVVTISGTSLSFGAKSTTGFVLSAAANATIDNCYDPINDRTVVTYTRSGGTTNAAIYTVTGTSNGLALPDTLLESNTSSQVNCVYNSVEDIVVFAYNDDDNNRVVVIDGVVNVGTAIIDLGNKASIDGITPTSKSLTFFEDPTKPSTENGNNLFYDDSSIGGLLTVAKITHETTSSGSDSLTPIVVPQVAINNECTGIVAVFDPNTNRTAVIFKDIDLSNIGSSRVWQNDVNSSILTTGNFLGIAQNTVSGGETVVVGVDGFVDPNQSGLTAGETYYAQADGSLSLTPGGGFPTPIPAGTSLSATKILIRSGLS